MAFKRSIVVAIYNHPEAYPPVLNAIGELCKEYEKVSVVHQSYLEDLWPFPGNVELIRNGKLRSVKEFATLPSYKKVLNFLSFTFLFLKTCLLQKPSVILVYDYYAIFSFQLIRKFFTFKYLMWYHSNDIAGKPRNKSIGSIAIKAERAAFSYIDIFTLPSEERTSYYNLAGFKGSIFLLPNYPSINFYSSFSSQPPGNNVIKLLYQGSIGADHGLEEFIQYLKTSSIPTRLTLIGNVSPSYREKLYQLISYSNVDQLVDFLNPVNYAELPPITALSHIGLAVHQPSNDNFKTAGKASNKIYEYAAVGLPVIYFDSPHYNKHLGNFEWAFGTDLTNESLSKIIQVISNNYSSLSAKAKDHFKATLHFEKAFEPVIQHLAKLQDGEN